MPDVLTPAQVEALMVLAGLDGDDAALPWRHASAAEPEPRVNRRAAEGLRHSGLAAYRIGQVDGELVELWTATVDGRAAAARIDASLARHRERGTTDGVIVCGGTPSVEALDVIEEMRAELERRAGEGRLPL